MKKNHLIMCIIALLILALFLCVISRSCNSLEPEGTLSMDSNAVNWNGHQELQQNSSESKGIHIPGFSSLVFTANRTTQSVNFFNPEENGDRLFLMTLYVDDELLWESGYCPAGQGYYTIELSEPLMAGEYSGYLRIQCFTPQGVELNGARINFDLTVQEE